MAPRSLDRYERARSSFETPLVLLALALIPILVIPALFDVSQDTDRALEGIGWVIWATFVVEYVTHLALAPDRREMIRTHKMDLVIIALPVLRPLRALRILRAGAGLVAVYQMTKKLLARRGLGWTLLITLGLIMTGGAIVTRLEQNLDGSNITSIGDGLWWAVVTCTTVGYGDHFPVTTAGRAVASVLMATGIGLLGVLTANIAAWFVEEDREDEISVLRTEIAELGSKLDQLLERNSD